MTTPRLASSAPALALLALLSAADPALAQSNPPPPKPGDEVPEVIIQGRRPVTPDFQEQYEYHQAEYERLRAIYEVTEPPRYSPAERMLRMPETLTGTVQGKSTLVERVD